ncbi:HAMP domain-containing histidine kinase [Sporolactobacillus shoreicorticis]|uniref:histidine kinase n=1 Tax=Sporolactobacillus shoreicorticis TaxID=1923877 RepID=A0ABW5S340_9BACL|nr:HAMP domain-containing sensor histidine kinase [Sporolactobacillus shoreicorticis]MCO7127070.1 HAMP domain-containing histidine kinase [Sporolactobacillus shoreicorticis]
MEEESLITGQSEYLADLKNGVKRLEQYIEQLKKISGISSQKRIKMPINKQVVGSWVALAASLSKNAGLTLEVRCHDESSLRIDKEQLSNAIQNIVVNSVEHAPPDSPIILSFEDTPGSYRITIIDQGPGFSEQALKEATGRFFTTKTKGAPHYGLGLTIAAESLANNHGELKLENSYVGRKINGAKVTILLNKR